eukprot:TRINITY_DN16404_c0_g2_i1.p1 TRINITY_DN16404_c0_g2~~TRINITY_DN16404_c0_g2_i1.p1  ORF type:complete len:438 (+),score=94.89 TRINITY_DN16404_c0_g2_i1:30-1316(+)
MDERFLSSQARFSSKPAKWGWGFDLLMNGLMHFRDGSRLFVMSQKKSYLIPKAGDYQIFRCDTRIIETQGSLTEGQTCCKNLSHYPQMHHLMGISGSSVLLADYQKTAGFVYRLVVWMSNLGLGRWIKFRPFKDTTVDNFFEKIPFFIRELFKWFLELGILALALFHDAIPVWSTAYYSVFLIFLPIYKHVYLAVRGPDAPAPFLSDFFHSSFFWRHIALIFNRNETWRAYRAYVTDGASFDNGGLMSMLHYIKIKKIKNATILCFDGTEDPRLTEGALIRSLENAESPDYRIIKSFKLQQCPIGIQVQGNEYWKVSVPPGPLPQTKIDHLNKERVLRISVDFADGSQATIFVGKLLVLGTEYNKNIGLFASQKDGFPYTEITNEGFQWGLAQRYRVLGKEIGMQVAKRDIVEVRSTTKQKIEEEKVQ